MWFTGNIDAGNGSHSFSTWFSSNLFFTFDEGQPSRDILIHTTRQNSKCTYTEKLHCDSSSTMDGDQLNDMVSTPNFGFSAFMSFTSIDNNNGILNFGIWLDHMLQIFDRWFVDGDVGWNILDKRMRWFTTKLIFQTIRYALIDHRNVRIMTGISNNTNCDDIITLFGPNQTSTRWPVIEMESMRWQISHIWWAVVNVDDSIKWKGAGKLVIIGDIRLLVLVILGNFCPWIDLCDLMNAQYRTINVCTFLEAS